MSVVRVGIGSNIDRERNIRFAIAALRASFGEVAISPVYEAAAIGFEGDAFYNLVASFESSLDLPALQARMKQIEAATGRTGLESKYSGRTLDIDLLTVDDLVGRFHGIELPRPEILENAYVLRPLADLDPEGIHPPTGQRYRDLWAAFDRPQRLDEVLGLRL